MSKLVSHHVVPHDDAWAIRKSGSTRVSEKADTQHEAIDRAREISRNQKTELFIHRPDGTIRERDSHGKDGFPPPG
jgi:uncharacterized protein YdaT